MAEQAIKQTREQIEEKRSQLESALLEFPDPWDMVEEVAEAFVQLVSFRPEPSLRKLKPGEEPHSPLEITAYSEVHNKWADDYQAAKDKLHKAEVQLYKYGQAKRELAEFGKKK